MMGKLLSALRRHFVTHIYAYTGSSIPYRADGLKSIKTTYYSVWCFRYIRFDSIFSSARLTKFVISNLLMVTSENKCIQGTQKMSLLVSGSDFSLGPFV